MVNLPKSIEIKDFLILKKFIYLNDQVFNCEINRNKILNKMNIAFALFFIGFMAGILINGMLYEKSMAHCSISINLLLTLYIAIGLGSPILRDAKADVFDVSLFNLALIKICTLFRLDVMNNADFFIKKAELKKYSDEHTPPERSNHSLIGMRTPGMLITAERWLGFKEQVESENGEVTTEFINTPFDTEYASNFYLLSFDKEKTKNRFPVPSSFRPELNSSDDVRATFTNGPATERYSLREFITDRREIVHF